MRALRAPLEVPALVAGGAAAAGLAGYALVEMDATAAFAVAALPVIAIGGVYLMTSGQIALWAAAFVLPMTAFIVGERVGGLFYQDLVVVVSLGAWIFATFIARGRVPSIPQTPVLGWPLVLFAAAVFSATLRGHYAYGESLIDQPLRLVVYAAIVAGLAGMTVPKMYRLLPWLFYPGVVIITLLALYYLATGGSSTGPGRTFHRRYTHPRYHREHIRGGGVVSRVTQSAAGPAYARSDAARDGRLSFDILCHRWLWAGGVRRSGSGRTPVLRDVPGNAEHGP